VLRTRAVATKGVVEAMSRDHEQTTAEGNADFDPVSREMVAEERSHGDEDKASGHKKEHAKASMHTEATDESDGAEQRDDAGKGAMRVFFGREKVCEDCRHGDEYGRHHAVNNAGGGGPDAKAVRPGDGSRRRFGHGHLFCEELGEVVEGFELEGIACGVEEEHGGLLADFALEACVWLDDELCFGGLHAGGERVPVFGGEDDAEVRDGNVVAVDRVGMRGFGDARLEVRDNLVAEKVEVDPLLGAATFRAAENCAVEMASGGEVVDGEGDVERAQSGAHGLMILARGWTVQLGSFDALGAGALGGFGEGAVVDRVER
jgi:hypothetical protein